MLYTIIPEEFIFGNSGENNLKGGCMEMDYMGEKVQVLRTEGNEYIISRLISTSPQAYLNPRLQPGSVIK